VWLVRASFDGRPANRVAQDKSGSWGALSFGYLFFVQAKKSNSPKRRKATVKPKNNLYIAITPPQHQHTIKKPARKQVLAFKR